MKTLYKIGIIGIILLGIIHSLLSLKIYTSMTKDSFWFIGTGLGLIFAGLANYMNLKSNTPTTFMCTLIINALMTMFALIIIVCVFHVPTMIVLLCSVLLTICCIATRKTN